MATQRSTAMAQPNSKGHKPKKHHTCSKDLTEFFGGLPRLYFIPQTHVQIQSKGTWDHMTSKVSQKQSYC